MLQTKRSIRTRGPGGTVEAATTRDAGFSHHFRTSIPYLSFSQILDPLFPVQLLTHAPEKAMNDDQVLAPCHLHRMPSGVPGYWLWYGPTPTAVGFGE